MWLAHIRQLSTWILVKGMSSVHWQPCMLMLLPKQEGCSREQAQEAAQDLSSEPAASPPPGSAPLELSIAEHTSRAPDRGSPVNRCSHRMSDSSAHIAVHMLTC